MATPELLPDEEYLTEITRIFGVWDDGECLTYIAVDDNPPKRFDIEIDEFGGHIDFLEGSLTAMADENRLALMAIAQFCRIKQPEIIMVEDQHGNLL